MSVFAGVYYHDPRQEISPTVRSVLENSTTRSTQNAKTVSTWPGVIIVHADVGAFGHYSHFRSKEGGAVVVAGEVLASASPAEESLELEDPSSALSSNSTAILSTARGTFCLASYNLKAHSLFLAVDRLGVRPLYYYADHEKVIFSSALRIIEGLAGTLGLTVNVQAVIEINSFGFPLGARTPFQGVHCFRGGEFKEWSDGIISEGTYWKWDEVPDRDDGGDKAGMELHEVFISAIRVRLGGHRTTRAFLSGGLDSRSVVTGLKSLDVDTHTYNISWRKSCDEILGAAYARHISTEHHTVSLPTHMAGWAWPRIIADTLKEEDVSTREGKRLPNVVWSGDGGSVGLGRVYMTQAMVEMMRKGDLHGAAAEILSHNKIYVCGGTFHRRKKKVYSDLLHNAVLEELSRFRCADPGKALLLFFLENDQRRHMAPFYEDIDLNRVEYQMPFFDGEFLAASIALPLDKTLYHRFYVRHWLSAFGEATTEVPWQAYPGHEPCPLALPEPAEYQWGRTRNYLTPAQRWKQMKNACGLALSPALPAELFSRTRVVAAGISAALTGSNYSYIFNSLERFAYYTKVCNSSAPAE